MVNDRATIRKKTGIRAMLRVIFFLLFFSTLTLINNKRKEFYATGKQIANVEGHC